MTSESTLGLPIVFPSGTSYPPLYFLHYFGNRKFGQIFKLFCQIHEVDLKNIRYNILIYNDEIPRKKRGVKYWSTPISEIYVNRYQFCMYVYTWD